MSFFVHDVGSVLTVATGVDAVVRLVRIGENHAVSYLVAWWHEGDLKEEWVHGSEVPRPVPDPGHGPCLKVDEAAVA